MIHIPKTRLTFELDAEERAMLHNPEPMTKQELWSLLEKKRFEELEKKTFQMSASIMQRGRCPICTL